MCFTHCEDKKHQRHIGQSIGMDAKFAGDGISMAQNADDVKRSARCAGGGSGRGQLSCAFPGKKMRLAA